MAINPITPENITIPAINGNKENGTSIYEDTRTKKLNPINNKFIE